MIIADISELENIADSMVRTSNELEDVLNKTKITLEEMTADIELSQYPQAESCIEVLNIAKSELFNVNERIQELKGIMLSVPSGYSDRENDYKNELSRMTSYLSLLSATATAVLSPDFPTLNSETQQVNQDELQKMVAGDSESLQISNIAAVSKIIEKEYPVKQVKVIEDE